MCIRIFTKMICYASFVFAYLKDESIGKNINHSAVNYIYSYIDYDSDFFGLTNDDALPYYDFINKNVRQYTPKVHGWEETAVNTHESVLPYTDFNYDSYNNEYYAGLYRNCYNDEGYKKNDAKECFSQKSSKSSLSHIIESGDQYRCSHLNMEDSHMLNMRNVCNFTKSADEDIASSEALQRLTQKNDNNESSSAIENRIKLFLNNTLSNNPRVNTKINIGEKNDHKSPRFHQFQSITYNDKTEDDKICFQTGFDDTLRANCNDLKGFASKLLSEEVTKMNKEYKNIIIEFKTKMNKIFELEYNKFEIALEKMLEKYEQLMQKFSKDADLKEFSEEYEKISITNAQSILLYFLEETQKTDLLQNIIIDQCKNIWRSVIESITTTKNITSSMTEIKLFETDSFFDVIKDKRDLMRVNLLYMIEVMHYKLLQLINKSISDKNTQNLLIQELTVIFQDTYLTLPKILNLELTDKVTKTKNLIEKTNSVIFKLFDISFEKIYNQLTAKIADLRLKQIEETNRISEECFDNAIRSVLNPKSFSEVFIYEENATENK